MLAKAVKNKFRQLFVFLLIATLLIQGVVPAYAGDNGTAHHTPTSANISPKYLLSWRLNLAVMLFDGEHNEFVMDNKELTASVEPLYQGHVTEDYAEKFNKEYLDKSVNWAYAQIFRRTQVAWSAPGAVDSLILMGPDVIWDGSGPGTVTMSADQTIVKDRKYFEAHRYLGSSTFGGTSIQSNYKNMEKGWHPEWGNAPNGEGVFKSEIKDYLAKKYIDKEDNQPDPDVFFKNLVANADASKKTKANRVWQYIAAGPNGVKTQSDPLQGPSYRWRKVFEGANRFDSDQVFIGADSLYEIKDGQRVDLDINDKDTKEKILDQLGSYFDTLVTLSVVADTGMESAQNKQISEKYLNAAIDCFGSPGAFINKLDELQQQKSIIFDTWTSHSFTSAGNAMGGSAGTYTDIWGAYRKAYQRTKGVPTSDWRSLSIYNDFHLEPLAKDSKAAKTVWTDKGGSIAPETMDRIALRLSTIQADKRPAITDAQLDIVVGSIWFPGSTVLGPTSALLGRKQGGEAETIALGLKADKPTYKGIDNSQLDMVGGQFAVFMYAQAIPQLDDGFTHGLSVNPSSKDVAITPKDELNQNIKVIYKFGNTFSPSGDVAVDARKLGEFVDKFKALAKDPDKKSVLEARTYLTRQVTKYRLDTLWMPGAGVLERVKGITPDTAVYDVPAVATALGTETVSASSFNNFNDGWEEIKIGDLKNMMLTKNCVMFNIDDDSYRSFRWIQDPVPEKFDRLSVVSGGRILETFTPGSDFVLEVTYKADTQIRVRHKDGSFETLSYTDHKTDPSVTKFTDAENVPAYLAKAKSDKYEPVSDYASFKYYEEPEYDKTPLPKHPFVKEPMKYAVYSSSPEAYAELKNWGVASYNEPGDTTGLGDGRSPVDTELGVKPSTASNGSDRINEDYEAMAGVPTTEKLYLAVGGSEFIIDIAVQYVPNETAVRTYHVHFDGVDSQYNYKSKSGAGGDIPEDAIFTGFPKTSSVGASITGKWDHTGGTITYTVSGSIDASGTGVVSGQGTGSGDPWSGTVVASEPSHPQGRSDSKTATINTTVTPNAADVKKFNDAMDDIEKWINAMTQWIGNIEFKAGSDGLSRKIGKAELGNFTYTKNKNSGAQGASGSFSVSGPTKLFYIDDNAGSKFNIIEFVGGSYNVTNPKNMTATSTKTHSSSPIRDKDGNIIGYTDVDSGGPASYSQSKPTWSITISFKIKPHVICGPECGHKLPEINDIWQQSFNYDYLKIIGLSVLRLDQGSANDETGRGLNALIGTKKLGVTRQTYYSSPTMSLAQANIFNYMGLQTDGTRDVYNATNEYFRSIAYGVGTAYGNTKSAEANRVQYFMTDADGKKLTVKGTNSDEFPRYENKDNQEVKTSFANEMQSSWGDLTEGIVDAGDYVYYDFGPRSNLSDGTSRGYKYNMDKRSWVEKVNGNYRGKAAYDLSWAKGFIYDGVQKEGEIDASGFSVSRSLRNSGGGEMGGIYQFVGDEDEEDIVKGWQGTGMTTTTLQFKTISYESPFESEFFTGQNAKMKEAYGEDDVTKFSTTTPPQGILYQPAVRDWSKTNHALYSDTRNLLEPGGASMPGATADWSPQEVMAKLWTENGKDRADDRFAQTQPYDTDDMLTAFTNTASDGGATIRNTSEYKLMQAKRSELVYATVISDALVLDLPNGYQPIMYHYKNAPVPAAAKDRIPDVRISFEELWLSNKFTPNGWSDSPKGTPKDGIIIGGYNGDLSNVRTTTADVQHRLRWRADGLPATPNMFIQDKAGCEAPTGIIGKEFGALVLNGYNINRHLGHNINIPTRVLSRPVTNKPAVDNPVQRTLLYNIAPIVLSAENREYSPGKAEVFWETVVMWKDDSNHDYYGKYITGDGRGARNPDVYMPDGTFVRLPDLLGNYGQKQRNEAIHTIEKGTQLMENYFKYTPAGGSQKLEAYGAAEARAAQAEQYARGFGVTGYNYDTTNTKAIDGKYFFKNMYNESGDLTGAAKANSPYVSADTTEGIKVGVPFLVEVVKNGAIVTNYKAETARRSVGSPIAGEPKSGYIQRAAYSIEDDAVGRYELNNIVIHNVVSARATQIMPIAEWRDQRLFGQSLVGAYREENRLGAPGTLDFAILDCKYDKPLELLKLNFIGSGNSVPNQAKDQKTTGNIIFAGNFAMTSTGLTSGGSARSGVSLADLGGEYYSALDYQVTAEITYKANTGEQMLFGFKGYGITLNTATKKLYIRKAGATGYLEVAGTFESGNTLKVRFSSSNATLSKVWVDGASRAVTLVGGEYATMSISKNQIGNNFYIGSWESTPAYTMATTTRIKNLLFERLAGSREHTDECKSITIYHAGGNNTHVHNLSCLGPESSHKYLAGAISAWNGNEIDDATMKMYLGDALWNQLGMPKKVVEYVKTTNNITLNNRVESIEVNVVKVSQSFSYTGDVQTFKAPVTGEYMLEVWGAEGGTSGYGGKGGYSKGTIDLTKGQVLNIYVGGQTGWNGGGSGHGRATDSGGGATDIRRGGEKLIVAGGGGGWGGRPSYTGGHGGGTVGEDAYTGYSTREGGKGGTQSAGGAGGRGRTAGGAGTWGQGGSQTAGGLSGGGGGGGGYYGGGAGGNDYPSYNDLDDGGGGGGSGYIGGVTDGSTESGVRSGNGYATISYDIAGGGAETEFNYTGTVQQYVAPSTGTYTLEVWGAQGGHSQYDNRIQGGLGGYSKGQITLNQGETISIYVGGQNGYNGGGSGNGSGANGGGASDIRRGGTALSNRIIVAGGGGGCEYQASPGNGGTMNGGPFPQYGGGHGGGTAGLQGLGDYTGSGNGSGGTQTSGYALGQGEPSRGSCSGAGGGGYYGGYAGSDNNHAGGGGSGYIGGVTGGTMQTGVNTGDGKVKITAPLEELEKKYTFTTGNMLAELNIIVTRLSGTSNMKVALHKGAAPSAGNLIKTVTGNPNVTFPATVLEPNTTYTIVVSTASAVTTSFNIKATLTTRNLKYSDIVSLPNVNGKAAWEQIPYYLPDGSRNPVYKCNGELNAHVCTELCEEIVTYDNCKEPHHKGAHYENDWLCYSPDLDDTKYDPNFVQNSRVNTKAAEFVSIDWDYTLYADTIDNLRGSTAYQLRQTLSRTGMGYYDTNVNGDFDAVRFIRGKYVKFPWTALYDGVLYGPDEWIVLGDRGTYNKGSTTNNKTGLGGSSLKSGGNLFNGQQVPYNVQNWSNYNQKEYHDLYKSFYDFYLPIVNDEQSLATVTYAIVAVNAPDDRDIMNSGGDSVLSAVGDFYKWVRSGTVSNRVRTLNRAEVGAGKVFKVDVVGRIGGFVVTDTTDVKFSDTFKKPLTPEEETTVVYDIDITDLYGTKAGRTTKALQASDSVITGGKLVDGPSGSPDRAVLTAASDWVGFDYSGGNARKFVITVKGNALQAGEFVVHVKDQANGAYTLRLADMTVNKKTSDEITVTVDVKNTTSAVDIRPRFNLIDTSVPNVYVTSMSIAIGGAGFSQGLNKVVDPTKQNFYLTDLTDVRGIYLGSTTTLNRATEGLGALAWQRYHNYTAVATALGDWIRMSDATQVRNTNNVSGRSTPEYGTRGVDTYGGRPWIQQEDPLYKALASSGGKALVGPLTSDHNVIPQYNRPEAQLSVGSKVFFDVTTVGNYYDMSSELEIIPSYYLVDTTWKDANGAVALIPVDIYQLSSSGAYQPVNIFGAPYGGFTPAELDAFNQYRLSINWEEEAVGASNRRMVTNEEWQATETYANLFTDWIFEGDPYSDPDVDLDGTGGLPPVIGRTESPRKPPLGVMPIGGAQYIYQDYRTQTFIGSNYTYGVDKSGGLFSDYEADPTQNAKYIYWQLSAQRWHSTLGLPSDAVFVPLQQDPVTRKFNHVDTKDIVTHAVDISENLIICYLDIYANGTVWKLHYGNQGLQRTFSIGEQSYKLPLEGAPGPAMANPYPGQRTVGSDYLNGGIPFVIFGGSEVEGQADIIKTN